jgi:cation diffusion facilitator CzcD-associated flavoprotein CzcO
MVVVVGAGPAGLATSYQLGTHGIPHVVLERGDVPGQCWATAYDSLKLHTGKLMSSLPGLPFPRSYPTFVPRQRFWEYLCGYAERFKLPVKTRCQVSGVRRENGAWIVTTNREELTGRALVMATGIMSNPHVPRLPGQERFTGRIQHSVEYRRADGYAGRRVLVVGVGNSGAEIASELGRAGANVTLAVRSGANVVPLTMLGLPIQYVSYWVRKLPRTAQEIIVALVDRLTRLRRGAPVLPRPAHSPLDAIPVIGFHLVDAIRQGLVRVAPGVLELSAEGARFADGSAIACDDVILATGFTAALAPLGALVQRDAKGFARRRDRVTSEDQPNLYFVGHNYDATGGLWNIRIDSRLAVEAISHSG